MSRQSKRIWSQLAKLLSKECKYDSTFFEDKGQFRVHTRREGRMLILDATEVNTAMYSKELKAESDIELWRKRVGHVNLGKLQSIQTKGAVHRLPRFTLKNADYICEACQLGKQHKNSFPSKRHVSKGLLDIIHSDVSVLHYLH